MLDVGPKHNFELFFMPTFPTARSTTTLTVDVKKVPSQDNSVLPLRAIVFAANLFFVPVEGLMLDPGQSVLRMI